MNAYTLIKLKQSIRIAHDKLNDDIETDVDACLADLRVHGIIYKDEDDALIFNAIKLYCKSLYTDDVVKSAEYKKRYNELRDCLKDAEGYGWEDADDE